MSIRHNKHDRISPLGGTREDRIKKVLANRWQDLELIIDNVDDPHNIGAILRTCDAVGVGAVHLLYPEGNPPRLKEVRGDSAASAAKWLNIKKWTSIPDCVTDIKSRNLTIYATALDPKGKPHFDFDLTKPSAIIISNETHGITKELKSHADKIIAIPMRGFVQSLNVSVAAAVVLEEAMRQRLITPSASPS
jgi:tRNA (guanosine-2'-O-)-methyltransferase